MGYYDVLRLGVTLGGERVALRVKAGMVSWDEAEMAAILLAESAAIAPGERLLLLEGGAGALAVWAARREALVHCYDGSAVAAQMARLTVDDSDVVGVTVHEAACPPATEVGSFDVALLPIPKGRAYARLLLGAACRALKPGGRLYLAGPNAGGAKAVIKDAAAILGRATTLRTKARHRVGLAIKGGDASGEVSPAEATTFEAAGLRLFGLPGVFSRGGLDEGTARLLETLDDDLCYGKRVLDVGCGSGAIGMTAARRGASAVDLVDSAWLAVACAEQGIMANGLSGVCQVRASDLYAAVGDEPYDLILSNPPFHAGHKVDTEAAEALIVGARDRLVRRGILRVVANRFLLYDRLMAAVFGRVAIVQADTRYHVLQAVRAR